MPRIITVTANPAIDRNYTLAGFQVGEVNRASAVRTTIGGKGINAARVAKTLGADVVAAGLAGGETGRMVLLGLDKEKIERAFVDISPAETRYAIIALDSESGVQTVVNEQGPTVTSAQNDIFSKRLERLLNWADAVVFSGSLAPGMPEGTYRDQIRLAKERGVFTLIDSSGLALRLALDAKPDIVKVNANELRGINVLEDEDWAHGPAQAALALRERLEIPIVALTLGAEGAVLAVKSGVYKARMPKLEVVSAVGSGDSFAAGLVYALLQNPDDASAALKLAAACGGANALVEGAGACSREQIAWVSGRIRVEKLA